MKNFWYLFAAYTVIWAVVLGFVLSFYLRERALRREVEALKELLDRQEGHTAPGEGDKVQG
ncbi:MAG: CcmD family protein [Chloroflexi bacterium]|nr:CcmD family protein [Chloroflexota bacterium]